MKAKILSLNVGGPAQMEWGGKSVFSSMKKSPVPGPLLVHMDRVGGNSFASPNFHGTVDSVLYAFGLRSAAVFMQELGGGEYQPGATGETVTLDDLDETKVSIGDIFRFGEVRALVTYPRIPCGKVNFRMQHVNGQKAMQACGRSGVYFKVLEPGLIRMGDVVERVEKAKHPLSLSETYRKIVQGEKFTAEEIRVAEANGSLPARILEKLR